ncbi:amino acid permease [Paenibacillus oryzisoli]|uniref:Transporter n=1 Tax=Paenibacillus oryzisoli TaxID=1850517 RepID=A0A198A1E9_9BACL|nr:amino acid permease [Paenibacillus oryzisoli]OAS14838.1 transporter [Paenibacillus oryzisoli]
MKWWQLSLLGVACTIGTGYFMGSGIGIKMGGSSVILLFVLAGLVTFIVFDVLARMTADNPQKGSFQAYAKNAYGRWAGFSSGWVYWSSELLIMGSQLTALSLFARLWFPGMPLWLLACAFAILGLGVILLGTKVFESAENVFAIIKISAILMFLTIALIAIFGFLKGNPHQPKLPISYDVLIPHGTIGIWSSFIFAFYAFGGIEIMGLMAIRLKNPKEAAKSGKLMIGLLTIIYVASLVLALTLLPLTEIDGKESLFQTALNVYKIPFLPHIFTSILIIAGFSTMVASLFAVTTILVTLAENGDSPHIFAKKTKGKRELPIPAILLTTTGITFAVVMSLLLPEELYEYVTTAAGIMLLYNWLFILLSSGKLLELTPWGKVKRTTGMVLILTAICGTLFHPTSRPGFWISLLFVTAIGSVTFLMHVIWSKHTKQRMKI